MNDQPTNQQSPITNHQLAQISRLTEACPPTRPTLDPGRLCLLFACETAGSPTRRSCKDQACPMRHVEGHRALCTIIHARHTRGVSGIESRKSACVISRGVRSESELQSPDDLRTGHPLQPQWRIKPKCRAVFMKTAVYAKPRGGGMVGKLLIMGFRGPIIINDDQ